MMAVNKHKVIFVITVAILLCMLTFQTEAKVVRIRRQECQDGKYSHNGRECCMCPAGFRLEEHCTDQAETKCEPCTKETYQSHANQQETCEHCTSCAQPNANLVVDRPCTPYLDSTCKCKEKHYCPSGKTPCKICEPCQECGPAGEKVACSATNNTICNDKPQDNALGVTLGVIIPLLVAVIIIAVGCFIWKKRKSGRKTIENGHVELNANPAEVEYLEPVVDPELADSFRHHIPEIAELIGWTNMRNLALNSKIPKGRLESCEKVSQSDSVEATITLLQIWEEKESKNALSKLIQHLKKMNQNSTVEDVLKILRDDSS